MHFLILLTGVFCCSLAVLFIKGSATDPVLLSAYRLLLGGLLLAPAAWRARQRYPEFSYRGQLRAIIWPSLLLSVHFITWIVGGRLTPAANATLLVNMTPVVMPFVLFWLVGEVLTRREWWGTAVSLAGVILLGAGDFNFSPGYALGDAISFGSMLLYAGYLGFASRNRAIPSIYLYVVPVYFMAGLIALAAGLIRGTATGLNWLGPDARWELMMILGLAIFPTVIGHSAINWSFKHFRGQVVAILNLGQFIFAGVMSLLLFGERPSPAFYFAAVLAVVGALIVTGGGGLLPARPTPKAPPGPV